MLALEKPISSKAVRPSGEIFSKLAGRLTKGSVLRNEMRLAALGSSCTASSRFAAANWLGVKAKELKPVVITTAGGVGGTGGTGGTGLLTVRNARVTEVRA